MFREARDGVTVNPLEHGANLDAEMFDPETLRRGATRFVQVKVFAQTLGMGIYLTAAASDARASLIFASLATCDLLLLIPYAIFAPRSLRAIILATYLSLAMTTLTITAGLFFAATFLHWGVLPYFFLLPLALLVLPRPQTPWVIAGFTTTAYLALLIAQSLLQGRAEIAATRWEPVPLVFHGIVLSSFGVAAYFTAHLTRSLQRERFFQRWLLDQAQARADAESIWHTVGQAITAPQDLEHTLTQVLSLINQKMRVPVSVVLLYDAPTDELYFAQVLPNTIPHDTPLRFKRTQGIAGWVVTHRQAQNIGDVLCDPRWNLQVDVGMPFPTRAVLAVPLLARDQVIGVIELLSPTPHAFTAESLQMLQWIAAPVTLAIQNAQLSHQVHAHLAGLNDLLDKVTRAKDEWEQTVDAIDAGIYLVDRMCRIVRVNRTLANWLGTTPHELVGQFCYQAIHHTEQPLAYCPHQTPSGSNARLEIEIESARLNRTLRFNGYMLHEPDGTISGSVNVLQDITAQKALQEQLIQSEKLTAIGRMAASLAHEINNPLQAIQGCLDLAQANPTNLEKQTRYLTLAKAEVDRLATMVQRMLDFYKPARGARMPVNVRTLLDEVLTLSSKRLQHARTHVTVEWSEEPPPLVGNANQLKQVFLNLILNATDAMPDGGDLHIHGRLVENAGNWIVVDFTDAGTGIAPEHLDKIFEPFYTTKTQGTGLGLGISHSIIASHGGRITVQSVVASGSTFTVWLPTT